MKVRIRTKVNTNFDFSRESLTVSQQISAAISTYISESKIVRNGRRLKAERIKRQRMAQEESLKQRLLLMLQAVLVDNLPQLKEQGEKAEVVYLSVRRKYQDIFNRVIKYREFNEYIVDVLEMNPDMIRCFGEEVPIIMRARKRAIRRDEVV